MSTDSTISTLNSLIKTTLDSMKGFKDAAQDAETSQFSTMFSEFAGERSEVGTHPVRTAATDGLLGDLASYLPRKASTPS